MISTVSLGVLAIDDEIAKDRTRFLPLDIKLPTAYKDWTEKRSQSSSLMQRDGTQHKSSNGGGFWCPASSFLMGIAHCGGVPSNNSPCFDNNQRSIKYK
jgi:hypothetical protein